MQQILNKINPYIILSMCSVYLVYFFIDSTLIKYLLAIITVLTFMLNVIRARITPRIFSIVMFAIGLGIVFSSGVSLSEIANDIIINVPLLTLLILVPLISIPIKIRGYFDSIHHFMLKVIHKPFVLFRNITVFIFLFGPILNLGSIRLLSDLFEDLSLQAKFLAKAYLTGFSTIILWSPYFASVAMVMLYLNLPVAEYIGLSLPFAFIMLIIGNLIFMIGLKRDTTFQLSKVEHAVEAGNEKLHKRKLLTLFLIVICLTVAIFTLEWMTKWSMLFLVTGVAISYSFLSFLFSKKKLLFIEHFRDFKNKSVPNMSNEIVMFISAGIFGKALAGTPIAGLINESLNNLSSISFILFSTVTILSILAGTLIGLHPIVIVIPLLTQLDPAQLGVTPQVLAFVIMLAWSMSALLSPVNPLNLLVSGSVRETSFRVGFRWSGIYVISLFVFGTLYLLLIQ
jgi:hypothetical protein